MELTRRASLIPSLVSTVQTFASHEKEILDDVTDARAALSAATDGKSVAQRSAADQELDRAVGQVLALGQSYPQLSSSNNFLDLQRGGGEPRQTRLRPPVLQRCGGDAQQADRHDSVDVRRRIGRSLAAGVLPNSALTTLARCDSFFAGTPEPAVPALRRLIDSPRHEVVAVLTRPDAVSGRRGSASPSPVAAVATELGIPVLRPSRPNSEEFVAELTELAPECCAVVAYGALLRDGLLAIPQHGWINLHFSLLPAWRGAAPVQAAIAAGDTVTGASTFQIEQGLDTRTRVRGGHRDDPADRHRRGSA